MLAPWAVTGQPRDRAFELENAIVVNGCLDDPCSIPGDPTGMPATAMPAIGGFSLSMRWMSSAGTCPSTMYPAIFAVWHECRSLGTPDWIAMTFSCESLTLLASTWKPRAWRCSIQAPQHPQVGDL